MARIFTGYSRGLLRWVRMASLASLLMVILTVMLVGGAFLPEAGAAEKNEKKEWRLDDFTKTLPPGKTYGKWGSQKIAPIFGDGDVTFYQFVHDGPEKHYIHLKSGKDNSFSFGLNDEFEVKDWPVVEWEWKVTTLPKGGDVRVEEKDDQAGAFCLIVDPGLFGFKSLCYLWENDGPKDTPLTSTKGPDWRYLILRTGKEDGTGKWYKERRNILKDYIRVYGGAPKESAVMGMQIDSNSTKSSGEVFYRNIYLRAE